MIYRLMTHKEMEMAYQDENDDSINSINTYITSNSIDSDNHIDPLYSIIVCDSHIESDNTNLALAICEELNSRFEPIEERKV